MSNLELAQERFKVAEMDLSSAAYLKNMEPVPVEIICYHCQQSAEKFLKGYLAFQGDAIRKTHDLVLLNKLCQAHEGEFKQIEDECLNLTGFGVQLRYPFPIEIDEADVALALKNALHIKDFVFLKCP
jgi:HEPN domain-containing protein